MIHHLDLFSGIGGFSLALDTVYGKENTHHTFVEYDPFCQEVLRSHWPHSEIHGDIHAFLSNKRFDIITGGFPCQPFSVAGFKKGTSDDRFLWPEMFRVIKECRPTWVIGENVTGIIKMALDGVLSDLESESYSARTFIIPACAVGAPHRRDRTWIVAHSDHERRKGRKRQALQRLTVQSRKSARSLARWADGRPIPKPRTVGVDDGILNRTHRIKSLGNAIVPQVAEEIFRAMNL